MSVLSHLTNLSNTIKIQDSERLSIDRSISILSTKVGIHLYNVNRKFVFGSYDRKTILKRYYDSNSDVDFMIVFSDANLYTPQTMMNRIKTFVQNQYSRSEIYQSSPTIVLELNHIKFELVPAYESYGTLYIPALASSYTRWISTNPNQIKNNLNNCNQANNYQIRKVVRLLKYWNVKNNKVYSSFELESNIIGTSFWFCNNLKENLFKAINNLPTYNLPDYKLSKVNRLKSKIAEVLELERTGYPLTAESKIKEEF